MLQEEEGPFGVFSRFQAWAAKRPDKVGGINHGFYCFYCFSMWVALPVSVLYANNLSQLFLYWFGLSAGAIFINKLEQ